MRLSSLFAIWLVFGTPAATHNARQPHVRFFNDSAKGANFYVDSRFGCSIPANPEGSNAYCDAETGIGKHTVKVRGAKLRSQSCELYVVRRDDPESGAEAHLSKEEHFKCFSYAQDQAVSVEIAHPPESRHPN